MTKNSDEERSKNLHTSNESRLQLKAIAVKSGKDDYHFFLIWSVRTS